MKKKLSATGDVFPKFIIGIFNAMPAWPNLVRIVLLASLAVIVLDVIRRILGAVGLIILFGLIFVLITSVPFVAYLAGAVVLASIVGVSFEFITRILVIIALLIATNYASKYHKAKKEKDIEYWIPNNIHRLEESVKEELKYASKFQNFLIKNDHLNNRKPTEQFNYFNLDERKEYLDTVDEKLIETYNRVLLPYYPYLPPAVAIEDIKNGIDHMHSKINDFWTGFEITLDSDVGKIAEKELFLKHGVDTDYLMETKNHLTNEVDQFLWNSFLSNHNNNPIEVEKKIINAGIAGEKRLEEELSMYSDIFTTLYNVRLEVEGNSVESDAVIVSPKGIYTIEAKNFSNSGSYSIRITKDGQWLKVWPNGNTEPMKNVVSQTNRHVAYKQRLINQELKRKGIDTEYVFIKSIIVIANDNVLVENESDTPVVRISQIYNYIQKEQDSLSESIRTEIADILKENMLEPQKFPHRSFEKELASWLEYMVPVVNYGFRAGLAHQNFVEEVKRLSGNDSYDCLLNENFGGIRIPLTHNNEKYREYMTRQTV